MAARGNIAKEKTIQVIAKAFGDHYLGEYDKKHYVEFEENGEMVQIAIALTCPKNPVATSKNAVGASEDLNFEEPITSKTEVTKAEEDYIAELLQQFNL